jgi:hypothetical protein
VDEIQLGTHHISIVQLVDTTGQGVFEFRVEIATPDDLESIPRNFNYTQCGLDDEGREVYVSPWLDLTTVLKEVEFISRKLKLCGQTFIIASNMRSRVIDQLL